MREPAGAWWRLVPLLAGVGLIAAGPAVAAAQVLIVPPEIMEKLVPANERPLALSPDGEALRFQGGTEHWEEALPPGMVDVDRDGKKDYIVFIFADEDSGRRALVARLWGDAADTFGPTVFYVIIEDDDSVSEWAGSPRLDPPARPKP
jgi:hypothetical protein